MRRQAILTLGILAGLLMSVSEVALAAPPTSYTVTNLGTIDGLVPTITGINASGQISGYISTSAGPRAVRYTGGAWQHVPGLENTYSAANAINAHGDLAGFALTSAGLRAFRFVDGAGITTFGLVSGGSFTVGTGINDNDDVVGYGTSTSGMRGWRAAGGSTTLTVLPMLPGGGTAMACGINNGGAVVGSSQTSAGVQHAYRINADNTTDDAGSFDGPTGSSGVACPSGIDDNGRIGGNASSSGATHAFWFDTGTPVDIDPFSSPSSSVRSVSAGVSVGVYQTPSDGNHAFVQSGTDLSADLNSMLTSADGWVLSEALAVNTNGAIAGDGSVNGVSADFLLTPVQGDTTPPTITAISASPSSIVPPNGAMVPVTISVTATDNVDPSPVCSIDSIAASGSTSANSSVTGALTGSVAAAGGATYTFNVTCSDASGNKAHTSVNVVVPPDTTPPVISSVTASPSTIWPPRGQMVTVTIGVAATDDSGVAPACSVAGISGPGTPGVDYAVTGQFTGSVAAVGGRTYTFSARCIDGAGNTAFGSVHVVVPPDTTAPVINSVSATPSFIWPPDNKMTSVVVSASATDDVDLSPVCALTAISGSSADAVITGTLSASVRATNGNVYTLTVTCSDFSGNKSTASAVVTITKAPATLLKPNGQAK